ncbi:MAG: hypothetical protein V4451_16280 [Pseudomonadota bacterium]
MTSPKDDERAQFEEFLNRRRISTACRADGDYVHGAARDWWVVWQASRTARAAVQGEPGSQPEGVRLVPVGEILQWMKYHHRPAEPDIGMMHDDFDLYDMDTHECKDCIPVLIVRADPLAAPGKPIADHIADASTRNISGRNAKS